jgi:hypothetical protein
MPSLFDRVATLCARGLIVAGSLCLADLVTVEQKPWYRWARDAMTSLGADTSHYVVHWPLWLLIVALGIVVAWLAFARRTPPRAGLIYQAGAEGHSD